MVVVGHFILDDPLPLSLSNADCTLVNWFQPATELIRDIAVLELEVGHLEQYLLSLYRKAFDQQISSLSPPTKDVKLKSPISTPRRRLEFSNSDVMLRRENSSSRVNSQTELNPRKETNSMAEDKINESGVNRSHSSLSQRSAQSSRASPPEETLGKALRACHSQPLSMMEVIYPMETNSCCTLFCIKSLRNVE